jgi:broad specificity phosphatase PhoE
MKRLFSLFLLCTIACAAGANGPAEVTTVILVRHAERNDLAEPKKTPPDPPLSERGAARATELARVLAGTAIDAILTTDCNRTRSTAEPLARSKELTPVKIGGADCNVGATYVADVEKLIREKHHGQTVVVVGHSDTTQELLIKLGIAKAPSIAHGEFDNLFVLTLGPGIAPRLVALRYGAVAR